MGNWEMQKAVTNGIENGNKTAPFFAYCCNNQVLGHGTNRHRAVHKINYDSTGWSTPIFERPYLSRGSCDNIGGAPSCRTRNELSNGIFNKVIQQS